jgi:hypothetical protein
MVTAQCRWRESDRPLKNVRIDGHERASLDRLLDALVAIELPAAVKQEGSCCHDSDEATDTIR